MSKESFGTINGHEVFVETGLDQVKFLLDKVNQTVNRKRVKAGDKWVMSIQFDGEEQLIAEIQLKSLRKGDSNGL